MVYVTLVAGLLLLLICGDMFVRGAATLAAKFLIPPLVIGMTVVAFGTSVPELLISLDAALSGSPGISIGNVVGSNIANILLVLGLPAIFAVTDCNQPFIRRNVIYVLGASLLFTLFCMSGTLSYQHGLVLIALMVGFLFLSAERARTEAATARLLAPDDEIDTHASNLAVAIMLIIGIVGMPLGARLTVIGASELASRFGVSEAAIGLTIVALGTSLPELVTAVSAAVRKHSALVLGNVLGSNLFNILAIMGTTALVAPIPVPPVFLRLDLWVMVGTVVAVSPFIFRRVCITRVPGLIFVASYCVYIYLVYAPRAEAIARAGSGG